MPTPPRSTLFPYTTLFRSLGGEEGMEDVLQLIRRDGGPRPRRGHPGGSRSEEHTSELQSLTNLVCRLLLEKKKRPPASDLGSRPRVPALQGPRAANSVLRA